MISFKRWSPQRFGDQFRTDGDYFAAHGDSVHIEDVSSWLSELAEELVDQLGDETFDD